MQHYCIKSRADCTGLGEAGQIKKNKKTSHCNWLECEGFTAKMMTITNKDNHFWFVCFGCRRPRHHAVFWRRLDWHKLRPTRFCPPGADLTTFLSRCCPFFRCRQCCLYIITYLLYYSGLCYSVMSLRCGADGGFIVSCTYKLLCCILEHHQHFPLT